MTTPQLACPLCRHTEFLQQQGRISSKHNFVQNPVTLMICKQCNYVLPFWEGKSIYLS
ncbi:hypothetical protein HTZ77_36605 [Nonomuraea sp. SMC257]|uniref:TFIIS-type domain-containing protein n=1 Tax=Nonomuraea montanisoli TaxID=2741721 RepID=A0A7Y6M7Z9_9ACTN|nr:hypothetical protein [Nonomuraea montanisoli]NUW36889.1 hypothetical protein [Nonomuraea montanisoli]